MEVSLVNLPLVGLWVVAMMLSTVSVVLFIASSSPDDLAEKWDMNRLCAVIFGLTALAWFILAWPMDSVGLVLLGLFVSFLSIWKFISSRIAFRKMTKLAQPQ